MSVFEMLALMTESASIMDAAASWAGAPGWPPESLHYCPGADPGGCGDASCPRREAAVPQRPFARKCDLTQHLGTGRYFCEGDKPGGCGDASCPRREGAVPDWPFTRKWYLTQHLDTPRYYCEGDKPGGCGDVACPHRAGAVPRWRPQRECPGLRGHQEHPQGPQEGAPLGPRVS